MESIRISAAQMSDTRLFNQMKRESNRLKSFRHWPYDYIIPSDLAKAGLFYLEISDRVQCAFCYGVIMNWKRGNQPYIRHINAFPLCPFLMGRDVGNVSLGGDTCGSRMPTHEVIRPMPSNSGPEKARFKKNELGINIHKGPHHPSLVSKDARLKTFLSWPQHAALQPEELAEAGFFYLGINDSVRCFYCDGGLADWEKVDTAWVEHARWYPYCSFVALNKGNKFIQSSLMKFQDIESASSVCVRENTPLDQTSHQPPTDIQTSMNDDTLIIHENQSDWNEEHDYNIQRRVDWQVSSSPHIDELCEGIRQVELEENRSQREHLMCKICMDQEVGVVFLPCGHLMSCIQCAPALTNCAICRIQIKGTIRTFIA